MASMVLKGWTPDQHISVTQKLVRNTNSQTGSNSLETAPSSLCFNKVIMMQMNLRTTALDHGTQSCMFHGKHETRSHAGST